MLGWREARRRAEVQDVPGMDDRFTPSVPGSPMSQGPKLRVYRASPGCWYYDLDKGNGQGQGSWAPTWGQALAVGMAALEAATVKAAA